MHLHVTSMHAHFVGNSETECVTHALIVLLLVRASVLQLSACSVKVNMVVNVALCVEIPLLRELINDLMFT